MPQRKSRREAPAVNAGSMADIAFLLLIFFLVTTTILEEEGVLVRLPVWVEESEPPKDINEDKVLTVKINKDNELLIENELAALTEIPRLVRQHILNPRYSPREMIVSLTHDRGTEYDTYLRVYDALMNGYRTLRDERAQALYGVDYADLDKSRQRDIRQELPLVISEAEPTGFGDS